MSVDESVDESEEVFIIVHPAAVVRRQVHFLAGRRLDGLGESSDRRSGPPHVSQRSCESCGRRHIYVVPGPPRGPEEEPGDDEVRKSACLHA